MKKLGANDLIAALLHGCRENTNQVHTGYHTQSSPEYDSMWLRGEFDIEKVVTKLNELVGHQRPVGINS